MIFCVCGASFERERDFKLHIRAVHLDNRFSVWRVDQSGVKKGTFVY